MATAHFFGLSQQVAGQQSDSGDSASAAAAVSAAPLAAATSAAASSVITSDPKSKVEGRLPFDFARDYHFRDELLPVSEHNPEGSQFALLL